MKDTQMQLIDINVKNETKSLQVTRAFEKFYWLTKIPQIKLVKTRIINKFSDLKKITIKI